MTNEHEEWEPLKTISIINDRFLRIGHAKRKIEAREVEGESTSESDEPQPAKSKTPTRS